MTFGKGCLGIIIGLHWVDKHAVFPCLLPVCYPRQKFTRARLRTSTRHPSPHPHTLQVTYRATNSPWHGGQGGDQRVFTLASDEYISQAYVRSGGFVDVMW